MKQLLGKAKDVSYYQKSNAYSHYFLVTDNRLKNFIGFI